ncbi:MAG: hypothetical protein RLZZ161_1571 [Bacteroidota bacterium]|jgi:hypothetical protein
MKNPALSGFFYGRFAGKAGNRCLNSCAVTFWRPKSNQKGCQ